MGMIAETAEADARSGGEGTGQSAAMALIESVERMRGEYASALPGWLGIQTFMRDARTLIQRAYLEASTPKRPRDDEYGGDKDVSLLECPEKSILAALMTCAQLGLRIGVNNEAILKPRWSKRHQRHLAVFEAGYQGLQKLAYQSGAVRLIYAQEVYSEDEFSIRRGHDEQLRHEPALIDDPGGIKLFYAFAKLSNGECLFEHWMNSRMERFREEYAPQFGPWWGALTYPQMGRKTMLKQLAKQLPITGEFAEAVIADEKIRLEPDRSARPAEVSEYEEPSEPDPEVVAPAPGETPGEEGDGTLPSEANGAPPEAKD